MGREFAGDGTGLDVDAGARRRKSRHGERIPAEIFLDATDPSIHMLGLPKSRPQFGSWFTIAMLAGILIALAIIFVANF